MPTNLPPEAQEAERRYRAAKTTEEKIEYLQEYIRLIPVHKGTEHLLGDLRKRLSKLRAEAQTRKGAGRRESPYRIEKEGAGQVTLIGPTNTGKSSLLAALTNAAPDVSSAPFTTWAPTPGMMPVDNVQIQLIDTPPLNPDFIESEMMDLVRRSDLILLVVDLQADPVEQLEDSIAILDRYRIVPAHLKETYDGSARVVFRPLLVVVNKADDESMDEVFDIFCALLETEWPCLPVSAATGRNLERLKQEVFDRLNIMRIYAKPPGRDPDFTAPFVMKKGSTVEDFAGKVHKDFLDNLKSARVWGSATFDGQMVPRDHVLHDGDVVELRT